MARLGRVGKRGNFRHSKGIDLAGIFPRDAMMPLLRFIAVAVVASGSIAVLDLRAVAEPLDKASCASLANDRKKLLTPNMQAALDRGPDWVKDHLNDQELEQVRKFLDVEAKIAFRCRGGGVVKKTVAAPAARRRTAARPEARYRAVRNRR